MRTLRDIGERFWEKVDLLAPGGCWEWRGGMFPNGYGQFYPGPLAEAKKVCAHRWAYEHVLGPVPDGLDLDHLCRNRACVNPSHLEPVSRSENLSRSPFMGRANSERTHCRLGHEFTVENTYVMPSPEGRTWRACRTCRTEQMRRQRAKA